MEKIIDTRLLAKAVIWHGSDFRIAAVFEGSTQRQCYFTFKAPKPTSPQSEYVGMAEHAAYLVSGRVLDFEEFVMYACKLFFPGGICHTDVKILIDREEFTEKLDKIIHPLKYMKPVIEEGAKFDNVSKRDRHMFKPAYLRGG